MPSKINQRLLKQYFLILILSTCSFGVQADSVYLKPAKFISQQFNGEPPKAKVIWLNKSLKQKIAKILQHKYTGLRIRYWQNTEQTVWVLNEIGKVKDITVGITVVDKKIKIIKVLVFRESRGWEIKHNFFTDQFKQLFLVEENRLSNHIDGISGATLSVRAVEKLAKIALLLTKEIL